jgi:hypothetical protein
LGVAFAAALVPAGLHLLIARLRGR